MKFNVHLSIDISSSNCMRGDGVEEISFDMGLLIIINFDLHHLIVSMFNTDIRKGMIETKEM